MKTRSSHQFRFVVPFALVECEAEMKDAVHMVLVGLMLIANHRRAR
jgi:hypothetical protein